MKINTKIKCKNQKDFEKQSIKTLLIKSIKTYKININRNIDKFIDQNQYPMLRGSLLLSSHIGKALRRTLRLQFAPSFTRSAPQTFFSIRPGGCVSHASHSLRLFIQAAARRNESVGVLYLDVRSAYYRVVRQLAVRDGGGYEQFLRVMRFFNLDQTSYQDLLSELAHEPCCPASGMDGQHEAILCELLSSTWFTSRRREAVYESLAGTRPGDGLADLVFGFVFKRILRRAMDRINELLDLPEADFGPRYDLSKPPPDRALPHVLQVVWADDLAIAYRQKDAKRLLDELPQIISIVLQENLKHALIPNTKPGKTEVQLILKGHHSKCMRAQVFNTEEPFLSIPDVPEELGNIRIVPTYRHLGTRVDVSVRHRVDLRARLGQAHTVYRKYRRVVSQNRQLSQAKRLFLFNSLVMSVLSYNIGTWGKLLATEMKYFKSKLYALYRGLVRCEIHELELRTWSNDRILAFLRVPSAETLLSAARLRYSTTLYSSAPDALWHLLAVEQSWLEQLRSDQGWFLEELRGYGPGPSGHPWEPDLHQWCQEGVKNFKPWIGRAVEHHVLQHAKKVDWREWHFSFLQECIKAGLDMEMPQASHEEYGDQGCLEACLGCHRVFKNRAAWSVHAFKQHGRLNKTREVIDGTRCHSCGKEYFTPTRLQHHLNYSVDCFRHWVQAGRRGALLLPGINNTQEVKDRTLRIPVLPSFGPQEQRFNTPVLPAEPDFNLELVESFMDYYESAAATAGLETLVEGVRLCCARSILSFSEVRRTLLYFADSVEQDPEWEPCVVPPVLVLQSARVAARRCQLSWFFCRDELTAEATDDCIRNSAWEFCRQQQGCIRWRQEEYVPKVRCGTLVFLHLFSGHRREGDLHSWLSRMQVPDGYQLMVISVDIIYDAIAGDLSQKSNQEKWLAFVAAGIVVGVLAGPPCETWSRSRLKGGIPTLKVGDGGPRLVRDLANPMGLDRLKIREIRQLLVANQLLCFTLMILVTVVRENLFMVLEHPAEPQSPSEDWLASIWRLFATRVFNHCSHLQKVLVYQGYYGSKSPKPTNLLICIGDKLNAAAILHESRITDQLPEQLVMGWDAKNREYSTASLKSYPSALCAGLASLAQHWINSYVTKPAAEVSPLPAAFVKFTDILTSSFNLAVARGADYSRSNFAS